MIAYQYDKAKNIIEVFIEGTLETQDILDYFDVVMEDDTVGPGAIEKVHFDQAEDFAFTHVDVMKMRNKYEALKSKRHIAKTEFIVSSDLEFGMARMVQMIFESIEHPTTIERHN